MTLSSLVQGFNTTPFLFVGSGLSRRYYGLPSWEGLLRTFIGRIDTDSFAFQKYQSLARREGASEDSLLPVIAALVERDFNAKWFDNEDFRTPSLPEELIQEILKGVSPFKAEIAHYLNTIASSQPDMQEEIALFKEITKRNITGIITTNYDRFLEEHTDWADPYIGQDRLIFGNLQNFAEIYKIHGCVSQPGEMVLTSKDYEKFLAKRQYLASKLLTIFVEYPVIFIGYSLSDPNIQTILEDIITCLSPEQLLTFKRRLVYVEWDRDCQQPDFTEKVQTINKKSLHLTQVKLNSFIPLYQALQRKKSTLPAKVLRMLKQELYQYTLTSKPTASIRVADIDDQRVGGEDLILAIGKPSQFGVRGLQGLSSMEWYRNIVLGNIKEFSADDLLQYSYPVLIKQNNRLPVFKLLSQAKEDYQEIKENAQKTTGNFENIITNTIRKNRKSRSIQNRSIQGIRQNMEACKQNALSAAMYDMACLKEHEIVLDDLEKFLQDRYSDDQYCQSIGGNEKSNLQRLVRIYDYLKYAPR